MVTAVAKVSPTLPLIWHKTHGVGPAPQRQSFNIMNTAAGVVSAAAIGLGMTLWLADYQGTALGLSRFDSCRRFGLSLDN